MKEGRWKALLRKSISACVAAMEIYNKPIMAHRDETFAVLAVNAWELLLKARLLRDSNNNPRSIQVFAPIKTKAGTPGKRVRLEMNRAGNPKTITLGDAMHRVGSAPTQRLDPACAANIVSLVSVVHGSLWGAVGR